MRWEPCGGETASELRRRVDPRHWVTMTGYDDAIGALDVVK